MLYVCLCINVLIDPEMNVIRDYSPYHGCLCISSDSKPVSGDPSAGISRNLT